MSSALRFSVIIPLEVHRGQAVRCVRGWAKGQTFPREQFEIIVASPTGHPKAELDEIRSVLAPQDRMLELDHRHDMDLCATAAEIASAEAFFFTESHCLPEPGTLAGADTVMREHPEWAGFSGRSIPITGNLLSKIEADWYGPGIEFGMNEHPWRKVLDQCFVVHRSAYFEAGGFDPAFGHFAEWLIAARFHALGLKIGYAPTVRIHHLYLGEFDEWHRFTADFLRGQMSYLALEPSDPLTTMFDEVPEWSRRHMLRRSVARRMSRMLLEDLRRSIEVASESSPRGGLSSLRRWHWRRLSSSVARAAAGHSLVLLRARRRFLTNRAALQMDLLTRSRARGVMHLGRCCDAIAAVERTRFVGTWARTFERDEPRRPRLNGAWARDSGGWEAGQLDEARIVGFLSAGAGSAEGVRWSEPAAYVELPLAAGRYGITLTWRFPSGVDGEPSVRFYLDERPIPTTLVSVRRDFAELRVDIPESSSPTRLGWVCSATREDNDDRALGLPVVRLAWTREDAQTTQLDDRSNDRPELAHSLDRTSIQRA